MYRISSSRVSLTFSSLVTGKQWIKLETRRGKHSHGAVPKTNGWNEWELQRQNCALRRIHGDATTWIGLKYSPTITTGNRYIVGGTSEDLWNNSSSAETNTLTKNIYLLVLIVYFAQPFQEPLRRAYTLMFVGTVPASTTLYNREYVILLHVS
jgi:hypothetical protein